MSKHSLDNGRDSMVVYRSFYDAIKDLPKTNQAEVWKAVFELGLNFNEIELTGLSKTIFTLIKPQIMANTRRYKVGSENGHLGAEHGKKGGRPKTPKEPSVGVLNNPQKTPTKTPSEPANENVNVNENENVNVNASEVISHLKRPALVSPLPEQPKNEDEEMSIYVAETTAIRAAIPKLVKAYGKEGKPGRVEQEFIDAARMAAKEFKIAFQVAVDGIVHKAGLCFKYETETEPVEHKFRQAPENWLHDQCWKKSYGKQPDGKPSETTEGPILTQIKKDMAARAWEKQQAIDEAIAWNERHGINTQTSAK